MASRRKVDKGKEMEEVGRLMAERVRAIAAEICPRCGREKQGRRPGARVKGAPRR